jgi:hypothetical protein
VPVAQEVEAPVNQSINREPVSTQVKAQITPTPEEQVTAWELAWHEALATGHELFATFATQAELQHLIKLGAVKLEKPPVPLTGFPAEIREENLRNG